ncbi:TetR/AcrR family transcriptional regulator [Rhodococcus sp. G-MC3]|uniref:TetR/AcrR family transcriptional regulator n=1 Tax=Rhodococcus sp. G-MC3 TaxID=3046209 RepID=UPI0024BAC5CF|nr:TetR/AcrR family transcriptional regulator [Rhodococcus sp. G-MC3]MDJ0395851.1 TetR/AcrR family transcriptional regulator [Rhodococcus sp. G-MC3]
MANHTVFTQANCGQISSPTRTDGRKSRWREHKIARRAELLDGTLAAIRLHGCDIGLDDIAAEIGISKTLLYKHFLNKNGLTNATMAHYLETTLAPRIQSAISEKFGEYDLTRAVITAYIETIAHDPDVYLYVMANTTSRDATTQAERTIAELLATVLGKHLRTHEMDSGGSVPFAFAIVGAVRLATHWWIEHGTMPITDLTDYLTMFTWGGLHAIAAAEGSPAKFTSRPRRSPTDTHEPRQHTSAVLLTSHQTAMDCSIQASHGDDRR